MSFFDQEIVSINNDWKSLKVVLAFACNSCKRMGGTLFFLLILDAGYVYYTPYLDLCACFCKTSNAFSYAHH